MTAAPARSIFEINYVVANLTAKQFHGRKPQGGMNRAKRGALNPSHETQARRIKNRLGGRALCCEKENLAGP
jgi:hypothetical protein